MNAEQVRGKADMMSATVNVAGLKGANTTFATVRQVQPLLQSTFFLGSAFFCLKALGLIGYFTLATAQVAYQKIPDDYRGKLPKYPIPALRIARLAVDKELKGIGKWLLAQAFLKVIQVADITEIHFIIVDAKETSKSFYEHYGFIKFNDIDLTYFILVDTVRNATQV